MEDAAGFRLLRSTGRLVARGWCQGADARDAAGSEVEPWDDRAASWSLLGAIVAVLERESARRGEMPLEELAAALYALADVIEVGSLVDWNDDEARSQDQVLEVISAATERYAPWQRHAISNSG